MENKLIDNNKYCISCGTNILDKHVNIVRVALPFMTTPEISITYKCCADPKIIDKELSKNTLNLIDADSILYIFAYNFKDRINIDYDTNKDYVVSSELYLELKSKLISYINYIISATNSRYYMGFIGARTTEENSQIINEIPQSEECFRYGLCSTFNYKGKRVSHSYVRFWKPYIIKILTEDLGFMEVVKSIEVDDILALIHTELKEQYNIVITGQDKDLLQIPSLHFNYKNNTHIDARKPSEIYLDKAKLKGFGFKLLFAQCIMGDLTDDIKGIPGLGPVAAFKALKDANTITECAKIVFKLFMDNGYSKQYFKDTYRALKLLETVNVSYISQTDREYITLNVNKAIANMVDILKIN